MMKKINQTGASHLLLVLGAVLIAAVGIIGYRIVGTQNTEENNSTISEASNQPANVPDQFNTTTDMRQASKALDDTSIEVEINPGQLDQDLNSLL